MQNNTRSVQITAENACKELIQTMRQAFRLIPTKKDEWQNEVLNENCMIFNAGTNDIFTMIIIVYIGALPARLIKKLLLTSAPASVAAMHCNTPWMFDMYVQSPLDEKPCIAQNIQWKTNVHFLKLADVSSYMEYVFELDRQFGKCRIERNFVSDFKNQYTKLAAAWTGLSLDNEDMRQNLSLHTLLRMIFLAFLESRGALDGRVLFLREESASAVQKGKGIYKSFLQPLFFETLNCAPSRRKAAVKRFGIIPFLNGGLFTPTHLEASSPNLDAPDDLWLEMINVLIEKYTFNGEFEQNALRNSLDPMMLGHVFESLMNSRKRSATGSFYTPTPIARHVVRESFRHWMKEAFNWSDDITNNICMRHDVSNLSEKDAFRLERKLRSLKVLDPAAGSGAFLQCVLEEMHNLISILSNKLNHPADPGMLAKSIAASCLYGVDIIPDANLICELRLWLEIIRYFPIGSALPPLPNLDMNIYCGDALAEAGQYRKVFNLPAPLSEEQLRCRKLRTKYRTSTGIVKKHLASQIAEIDRLESERIGEDLFNLSCRRCDALSTVQKGLFAQDEKPIFTQRSALRAAERRREVLRSWRKSEGFNPRFSFDVQFADVQAAGGFDIIIGNPPWLSMHTMPKESQDVLRGMYQSALLPKGNRGRVQSADVSALFVEKALEFTKISGIVAMLVPSKLFNVPSYASFRQMAARMADPLFIEELSTSRSVPKFDAAAYPTVLIMKKTLHIGDGGKREELYRLPPENDNESVSDLSECQGKLLGVKYRIRRGICTGCNDIYIGTVVSEKSHCARIRHQENNECISLQNTAYQSDIDICQPPDKCTEVRFLNGETAYIETSMIHPVLRGTNISSYHYETPQIIVFTHDERNPCQAKRSLPEASLRWFEGKFSILEARHHGSRGRFYSVLGSCAEIVSKKVVWRDISKNLEACYISNSKTIPVNTVYYIAVRNDREGYLMAAWLNSSLVRKFCRSRAAHAQNGYRRYMGWVLYDVPCMPDLIPKNIQDEIIELSRLNHCISDNERIHENAMKIDMLFANHIIIGREPPMQQKCLPGFS